MVVIARDGEKSLMGCDWLSKVNFHAAEARQSECTNMVIIFENKSELSPELNQNEQKFPKIFSRQGKFTGTK